MAYELKDTTGIKKGTRFMWGIHEVEVLEPPHEPAFNTVLCRSEYNTEFRMGSQVCKEMIRNNPIHIPE